jgi:hypothetical protein
MIMVATGLDLINTQLGDPTPLPGYSNSFAGFHRFRPQHTNE